MDNFFRHRPSRYITGYVHPRASPRRSDGRPQKSVSALTKGRWRPELNRHKRICSPPPNRSATPPQRFSYIRKTKKIKGLNPEKMRNREKIHPSGLKVPVFSITLSLKTFCPAGRHRWNNSGNFSNIPSC